MLAHGQLAVRETAQETFLATLEGDAGAAGAAGAADPVRMAFAEVVSRLAHARSAFDAEPPRAAPQLATSAAADAVAAAATTQPESNLRASLPPHLRATLRIETTPAPAAAVSNATATAVACGGATASTALTAIQRLLADSEAEGLLGLATALLPRLPARFAVLHWRHCWAVLDLYLGHTASTVRQAASTFFERMLEASPRELRPTLVRLCLQSLSRRMGD